LRPNLERKWAPLLPFPSQRLENLGCANDSIMYLYPFSNVSLFQNIIWQKKSNTIFLIQQLFDESLYLQITVFLLENI